MEVPSQCWSHKHFVHGELAKTFMAKENLGGLFGSHRQFGGVQAKVVYILRHSDGFEWFSVDAPGTSCLSKFGSAVVVSPTTPPAPASFSFASAIVIVVLCRTTTPIALFASYKTIRYKQISKQSKNNDNKRPSGKISMTASSRTMRSRT